MSTAEKERFRPHYHFSYAGNGEPGDANGPFWANGRYHLMYLIKRGEAYCWAHVSSENLLQWRQEPDAISPSEKEPWGGWSGGSFVAEDGTAYLTYWMLKEWEGVGLGITKSTVDSDYTKWEKYPQNPVVKATEFGFARTTTEDGKELCYAVADPSNIWKQNGKYYFITGNLPLMEAIGRKPDSPEWLRGDHADLFESDDLNHWKYVGPFYQRKVNETRATGWTDEDEDCMCPCLLPLPGSAAGGAPSNKHILLFISHNHGCQYYIGTLGEKKFIPEKHGRMTWQDKSYFAPDAMLDQQGRVIVFTWLRDNLEKEMEVFGWSGVYGMPRFLWLRKDGTLGIAPVAEMKQLRLEEKTWKDIILNKGECLDIQGIIRDCCELEFELDEMSAKVFALNVHVSDDIKEKVVIRYMDKTSELVFDAGNGGYGKIEEVNKPVPVERAPFKLKNGEVLSLRVFVDGPVIEVFANDRQAICRRFFPAGNGKGIRLEAMDGTVICKSLSAWTLTGFQGILR